MKCFKCGKTLLDDSEYCQFCGILLDEDAPSRDENKAAVYETNIEDMLSAIQERLDELSGKDLDAFDKGRQMAFAEMLEIIKTRHKIIWDVTQ